MTVWTELQIDVAAEAADLLASVVAEMTGGVEVRDAGTLARAGAGRALIVAHCAPDDADTVVEAIGEACRRAGEGGFPVEPPRVSRRAADESEWRDVWKQYFRATRVGRSFLVRPTWDRVAAGGGDRVIDIDPGRAFGTGGHASTRLCMVLAEEIEGQDVRRFLDLGCGSGILAIAAARLWPGASGLALDVDPEAAACATENLGRNAVASVEARTGTLASAGHGAGWDVMLANIQADVLIPLAPGVAARLVPGGRAILSGILDTQAAAVVEAYQAAGLALEARRDEDEWAALRLRRP
jgi:ribosomal protein L11 methyltransferase